LNRQIPYAICAPGYAKAAVKRFKRVWEKIDDLGRRVFSPETFHRVLACLRAKG
jgi:hypothetical protein